MNKVLKKGDIELITQKFTMSSGNGSTELNSGNIKAGKYVDLSRSALGCLDFWKGLYPPVSPYMKNSLSVIDLFRRHNIPVIHTPHLPWSINGKAYMFDWDSFEEGDYLVGFKNSTWKKGQPFLARTKNARAVNSYEIMDTIIQQKNIDTLFYAGYSVQWCMLGRPNSMYEISKRCNRKVVLIKNATNPNEDWHTEWAHHFFETKYETIMLDDLVSSFHDTAVPPAFPCLLPRAHAEFDFPCNKYDNELGKSFLTKDRCVKTALIIFNAWSSHENKGFETRLLENIKNHMVLCLLGQKQRGLLLFMFQMEEMLTRNVFRLKERKLLKLHRILKNI